jgi:hypothetical protein
VQPELPAAEAASDTQQPAGGGKKEKEHQRKERQRQRRMEEAREAAGSDGGDGVGREVREPSVVDVHRQVSWGGGGVYVRVAGCTHVWR